MMQEDGWPRSWSKQIGSAVLRHRKRLGLSAQALSDKCGEAGFPIPRTTIANLESGRKESVPVHEVLILARALDVAPIDLLFPVVKDGALVPDYGKIVTDAARFTDGAPMTWNATSEFRDYRDHGLLLLRLVGRMKRDGASDYSASAAEALADLRDDMEQKGLPLPDLEPEIAWWFELDELGLPNYRMGVPEGEAMADFDEAPPAKRRSKRG